MATVSSKELFSKKLPVVVKSNDRDDKQIGILVTIELYVHTAPLHRKELVVRLTDENDLFFLYTLRLGEEDFQSLKCQQGLLVDFGAFPQKFIDLLHLCLEEQDKESPRYLLQFGSDKDSWCLNIVETNPFKHLTHLSLRFLPGRDTDVKKYLADCLKLAKDQIHELNVKLETTEDELKTKLSQTQQALSDRCQELDQVKLDLNQKTQELNNKYSQQITMEKEKYLQVQTSSQQRYEKERKELETAHLKIVKNMESRVYDLENSNKDLTDMRYKHESLIRELKSRLSGLEEDHHHAKQELSSLRKDNASLDGDYHEQEKIINQLHTRIAVADQESRDREMLIEKTQDILHSEQEQKKKMAEEMERKLKHIGKLETSIKTMSEELVKGNEIIKRLQGEIRNYHAKVKLRNQITTEQEKLLGEREQEIETLKKELESTKTTLKQSEDENGKLTESLDATVKKLEESKQLLKTNENVINWLNRQITENQMSAQRSVDPPPLKNLAINSYTRPLVSQPRNTSTPASNMSAPLKGSDSGFAASGLSRNYSAPQLGFGRDRISALKPSTIAEEKVDSGSTNVKTNKENNPPALDLKYLQQGDGVPLRSSNPRANSPNIAGQVAKNAVQKPPQKTTPSAYFPSQTKVS
ncbi:spindle assembly abnormal protein 6 homolog [Tubulanus polymorphus]|uniref:spindle assembly abnormal protein 6 homolog n=1 Tax=Tubulanus polymorphus TaxID=672921 RepID=UPI003DA3724A